MLWRAKFDTWEPGSSPLPSIEAVSLSGEPLRLGDGDVLVGGFDPLAQVEIGVWSRLLAEAGYEPRVRTLYLCEPQVQDGVRALTPRSRWSSTFIGLPTADWQDLILPDRPERSFAGVRRGNELDPLMIGLPTEEAWDRFLGNL